MNWLNQCHFGDCLEMLRKMPDGIVQTCVTSPPYFGLRKYGSNSKEIGTESTPDEFIKKLVDVFREVRRVLKEDGTLWVNIGDSYCSTAPGTRNAPQTKGSKTEAAQWANSRPKTPEGMKQKDLIGIPWLLAFALRTDGWYLRQDIIWSKPNPMPESVTDRCTKAHEYMFLLSKSPRYYYDSDAIKEPAAPSSIERWAQDIESQIGSDRVPGKTNGTMKAVGGRSKRDSFKRENSKRSTVIPNQSSGTHRSERDESAWDIEKRNKRSVWTVATTPYKGAHFATFPPALIEPCVMAGSKVGDVVLDPFFGSGTTGQVAQALGRNYIGLDLYEDFKSLQDERTVQPSLILEAA